MPIEFGSRRNDKPARQAPHRGAGRGIAPQEYSDGFELGRVWAAGGGTPDEDLRAVLNTDQDLYHALTVGELIDLAPEIAGDRAITRLLVEGILAGVGDVWALVGRDGQ